MKGGVEVLEVRPEQLSGADLGDQQVLYYREELRTLEKDVSTTKKPHSRSTLIQLVKPKTKDALN